MEGYQGSYQNGNYREVEFQRLTQNIGTNIQKILQNVSSIQRMISQIGTPQDNQQLQNQLHHIQHYTGQLAKETTNQLRELNNLSNASLSPEPRQWRLQRERLHNDLTKALNTFQTAQRTVAQKEKDFVKRAKNVKFGAAAAADQDAHLIDVEGGTGPSQSKTQLLMEEEQNIEELQERERSIRQLESDIVDVNTIFKDLATMVHEQGEMIDSIEQNVESAHIRVDEGTYQLSQAERYKTKARKKKCILALIGVILLVVLIAIIAWQAN